MLATAIAMGHHPRKIREMMQIVSRTIFQECQAKYSVSAAKWSNRYLDVFCREAWDTVAMADLPIHTLIPAYYIGPPASGPETFTNASNILVRDAVMRR
jgi:hypothetical protein